MKWLDTTRDVSTVLAVIFAALLAGLVTGENPKLPFPDSVLQPHPYLSWVTEVFSVPVAIFFILTLLGDYWRTKEVPENKEVAEHEASASPFGQSSNSSAPKPKANSRRRQLAVYLIAAAIATVIIGIFGNVDRSVVTEVGRDIIPMTAFLAAGSIVMTQMYMGQVLQAVPKMIESMEKPYTDSLEAALVNAVKNPAAVSKEEARKLFKSATLSEMKDWNLLFTDMMGAAKMIRKQGWGSLYFLVASALFAVIAILSGAVLAIGVSLGLIIVALWSIRNQWEAAEEAIKTMLQFTAFMKGLVGLQEKSEKKTAS